MTVLNVNGKTVQANADPRTPLLWVLRDTLGMTGTKYGCGIAQCGACTVHIDGVATRSCSVMLSDAAGLPSMWQMRSSFFGPSSMRATSLR